MNDFPKIIHQSWKTTELRPDYQKYSQTWKDLNPDYQHILWTDENNLKLIEEEDPSFVDSYNSYNHYIKRADAARYYYMYVYGGIYADLDFECLRNFDNILNENSEYDVIVGDTPKEITPIPNAIMISKPGAKFWLHLMKLMKSRVNHSSPPVETGPFLLNHAINTYPFKQEIKIADRPAFYELLWDDPHADINYKDFEKLTKEEKLEKAPLSYAVSYWSSSWQSAPDVNEKYEGLTYRGKHVKSMEYKAYKNEW